MTGDPVARDAFALQIDELRAEFIDLKRSLFRTMLACFLPTYAAMAILVGVTIVHVLD